ncbi:DNA replication complex GINS protein PSF2-like protein [Tanacetum coccineum]
MPTQNLIWLAVALKKRGKCQIRPPNWMSVVGDTAYQQKDSPCPHLPMKSIWGEFGPFHPAMSTQVLIWLVVALKKRGKCQIRPPDWIWHFKLLIDQVIEGCTVVSSQGCVILMLYLLTMSIIYVDVFETQHKEVSTATMVDDPDKSKHGMGDTAYQQKDSPSPHLLDWMNKPVSSAIKEVQQQENDARENPKGASNVQGAMIDDIGSNIENSCCNCTDKISSCASIKNSKEPTFHDDTANQTDDDTANHLCKHDRKENESETNCGTSQQQTSAAIYLASQLQD